MIEGANDKPISSIVVIPGTLALLPRYASLTDQVAPLRAAVLDAVSDLTQDVEVVASARGLAIAKHFLGCTDRPAPGPSQLIVANGSAKRSEKAPGFFDERAHAFDDTLLNWMCGRGVAPDWTLADELWANIDPLIDGRVSLPASPPEVHYDNDPFGVRYWVLSWRRAHRHDAAQHT